MIFSCPICHLPVWRRALCEACAGRLHASLEPFARADESFNIYSLFIWERDRWPGLNWWLTALKGHERLEYWHEPALWALELFGLLKTWPKNSTVKPTLVPVPSNRSRNHARGFARAIGVWSDWPVRDILRLESGPRAAQKRLTRTARVRRTLELVNGEALPRGSIILIDDIVTTGGTIRAAYRALGCPAEFRAWCLADRRPCGDRAALL